MKPYKIDPHLPPHLSPLRVAGVVPPVKKKEIQNTRA